MATDPSRRELPNTYFVQDRSSEDEFSRLQVLDRMLTTGMGGVLPEQPDPTRFKCVLVPDDYETLYQQMLTEIQQPGFVGSWSLLTAWGQALGYDNYRKMFGGPR